MFFVQDKKKKKIRFILKLEKIEGKLKENIATSWHGSWDELTGTFPNTISKRDSTSGEIQRSSVPPVTTQLFRPSLLHTHCMWPDWTRRFPVCDDVEAALCRKLCKQKQS
ncbi:unnamed protein product [Allacma fusca]|uniref:Uncharacterized protein n=1 Tax=Allacma fusca TaxID=39272 RepID=A0A8J2P7E8_9HEXA|nr:unnamed protein product [Allacma fusca]